MLTWHRLKPKQRQEPLGSSQRELLRDFEKEARNNSPESEGFFAKAKAFWDGFGG